jgi:hypothetical protein
MKTHLYLIAILTRGLLAISLASTGRADDPSAVDEAQAESKKLNDFIEKSIDWYEILPSADSRTSLRPQPVLRWRNVARGQAGEAMMVIWCQHGRPEVMASIFPWEGRLHHEFGSLSRAASLVARDKGAVVWSPNAPGIKFEDVPDAPEPAETAAARMRQMKSLAERFRATMTGWKGDNSDREELRLLPRPLYRYDLNGSTADNPNLQDGALFGFVMGTDPEVVMLLEAVSRDGRSLWQYAFARATSGGLEARLDGKVVWVAEKYPANRVPTSPQLTLGRPLAEQVPPAGR